MIYQSIKTGKKTYAVPRPKRRIQISADVSFSVCHHKGRWVVALTKGYGREFRSCDRLNRTEALKMISFLSDYVNLVKPTEATHLNKTIRAKLNSVTRDAEALTGLAAKE